MSFFFGGGGSKVKPQFTGLALQTSTSSVPISLFYGKNRGAGNILWQGDFQSHKQKQRSGKGGGKSVTSYTYSGSYVLGLCWGPVSGVTHVWKDQSKETSYAALGFSLFVGNNPQAPWGYLSTAHPSDALGYPDIAYLAVANYDLGQSNAFPQHSFEVEALLVNTGVGGTVSDADPALVIEDFLSDPTHGVGFNTSIISNMLSTPAATTTGDGTFQTYCRAMGFAMSPFMANQERAGEIIQRWADLFNTAVVWTGYSLKFHPYGPDTVTAHGVTYVPDFPVRYTITDADYIHESGSDPIKFNRTDPADAFNSFSIVISNKDNEYNELPVPWRDQGLIDQYGLKNEDTLTAKEITDPDMAALMVTFMGQRKAYIRNTFEFKLPVSFCLLEPMDLLICKDPVMGSLAVLIREVNENEDDQLEIVAEEYPSSISTNASTSTQAVSNTPVNTSVASGSINPPIIFEPPSSLAGATPQVWAAVSGGNGTTYNPNWGGCYVWISTDNITYNQIGDITTAARQGKLTASLAAYGGTNPDTANTLSVDMTMSHGQLEDAASAADAEAGVTVSYVGGEFLSYEDVTLTSTDHYNIIKLWRKQYGSVAGSHSTGTNFARLDDAIFRYDLPADYIGKTLYLKFQSYNIFGGAVEDISTVTAYTYTPTGAGAGTGTGGIPAVPTGLSGTGGSVYSRLTWTANSVNDNLTGYEVWRATGTGAVFGSATRIATTPPTALEYVDSGVSENTGYTYFLVAINSIGSSAATTGVNVTTGVSTVGQLRLYGGLEGKPTASQILFEIEMKGDEHFPANLSTSLLGCEVAPTGSVTLLIKVNGTTVGSASIAGGSTTGTYTLAGGYNASAGDKLAFYAPSTQNPTLSGLTYSWFGTRS